MPMLLLALLLLLLARPAAACNLALLFAVDVSGSVDHTEYRIQMEGLAHALRHPPVADALVGGKAALAVVQWTGASRQRLTVPWTSIESYPALDAFAAATADNPRVWRNFSTAIGEALRSAAAAFDDAPDCARKLIDISGDGVSNEGLAPQSTRALMAERGITVNALVIEDATADDLTGYFFESVITGPGAFVVTADGYADYPDRIREKLLKEVIDIVSALSPGDR
ncbi:MAG: DUF1194 domain-containing protein [Pseudomonadota bacterium]